MWDGGIVLVTDAYQHIEIERQQQKNSVTGTATTGAGLTSTHTLLWSHSHISIGGQCG